MQQKTFDMNPDAERLIALPAGHADGIGTLAESEWGNLIGFAVKSGVAQALFTYLKSQNVSPPPAAA